MVSLTYIWLLPVPLGQEYTLAERSYVVYISMRHENL